MDSEVTTLEWKLGADIRKYARVGEQPEPWRTSGRGDAKKYQHDKQSHVSYMVGGTVC